MPAKRARDEDAAPEAEGSPAPEDRKPKKAKHGFRVGPENLPDGAWKRKVTKIKKDLITKAKVKKQYAKIKAEHQKKAAAAPQAPAIPPDDETATATQPTQEETNAQPAPAPAIHPERQAMLDSSSRLNPEVRQNPDDANQQDQPSQERRPRRPRNQRPDYFNKELAEAEKAKKAAEERAAEFARREQERQQRIAERERYRRAMAKAKAPGRDGKRKLGRESKLLLDKVKKMMEEKK
ncbi:hypothetical protein VTI74DRAFT_8168 [Chaetomium olivicolor]